MKKYKKNMLIVLVIMGILLCYVSFTLAKYVYNSVWDYYLQSQGFYFSSDHLGASTTENMNESWDGEKVYFNIKNSKNNMLVTGYDINYKAVCQVLGPVSSYAECLMNGTDSNTQNGVLSSFKACTNVTDDEVDVSSFTKSDCEAGGYIWEYQAAIKNLYFDVILTDNNHEITDVTVNVTVTSTSPYKTVLSGDFILNMNSAEASAVTMNYKNYSNYDRLVVSNSYLDAKCVKINWDSSKLLIDANKSGFNSYKVDSNDYINEIILNVDSNDSLSYIFYKRDFSNVYDISEFTIEELEECE